MKSNIEYSTRQVAESTVTEEMKRFLNDVIRVWKLQLSSIFDADSKKGT